MNKTPIYLTVVLALSSLIFFPTSSGLSTSSVNVPSSGTVQYLNLNNGVIIYGPTSLSDADIQFVADHFNLVIWDFDMEQSVLQSLKMMNPNILIFGYCDIIAVHTSHSYWSTANSNENCFLHDSIGNRIINNEYGYYLMDPSSSGWQQLYSSYVKSKLENTLFDGVFSDEACSQLSIIIGSLADASTKAILTASDIPEISNWHSNMISMLRYVKDNLPSGKKIIINTDDLTGDYLNVVDGKMDEGFAHASWWTSFENPSWFNPLDHINAMARDSATGKIFVAENSAIVPDNSNSTVLAELAQNINYCYAATLLGVNGTNCYFGYNAGDNGWYTFDNGVYGAVNMTSLGSPSGSYYLNQSIYMRDFADGKVLFNPSDKSYNINLGKNYQLTNGTIVSSIVLGSWTGEILLSHI